MGYNWHVLVANDTRNYGYTCAINCETQCNKLVGYVLIPKSQHCEIMDEEFGQEYIVMIYDGVVKANVKRYHLESAVLRLIYLVDNPPRRAHPNHSALRLQ